MTHSAYKYLSVSANESCSFNCKWWPACFGCGHFAEGFSQSELFSQLHMAASYGGGHFFKAIFGFSLR